MSRTPAERIRDQARDLLDELGRFVDHHEACERCSPPHDGKPRLRPHTIAGWWQVWSGGLCIALLEPDDIKAAGLAVASDDGLAATLLEKASDESRKGMQRCPLCEKHLGSRAFALVKGDLRAAAQAPSAAEPKQ